MRNFLARLSLSTGVLGGVAAIFVVIIGARLIHGTEADALLATPPKIPKLPQMKLDVPMLEAHLEPVRDHPLFYASRAFYVSPPPPQAPTAPPRPNYALAGTFVIPHKHTVALLKPSTNGSVVKVKAGDDLEGWHIESVDTSRVLLRYQDSSFEIARTVARASGGHVTRVPLMRSISPAAAKAVSLASAAGATTTTETTTSAATPTVRSLGDDHAGASIRGGALGPAQAPIEARLYRPPPQ